MLNNMRKLVVLVLLVALAISVGGCLKKMNVSGSWVGFVIWDSGDPYHGQTTTIRLDLVQDRRTITGVVHMDADFMNLDMDIASGDGSNDYLTLNCAGAAQGGGTTHAIFLTTEGLVNGDTIDGTGVMTVDGVAHSYTWQAQRSAAAPSD